MRPLDPRLLTRIGTARPVLVVLAILTSVGAALVLLQALVLARLLAPVLSPGPLTDDGLGPLGILVPVSVRGPRMGLVVLACIVAARVVVVWAGERLAHRAGARAVSSLRTHVVIHVGLLGPRWLASGAAPEAAVLVTRGLEGLHPYFTRYLPSLFVAATVTPLAIVVVWGLDLTSVVIVLVTLPLVPLFMWLVGQLTDAHSERHIASMASLGARTLDLATGLPTLQALGRSRGPAGRIKELGEAHRAAAMGSLRVAFLSGMVLELLTTLSVALVAVSMGFRLASGAVGIETALAVLVLAPEVFLPLRNVGTHFHAAADGVAAAHAAFAILDIPAASTTSGPPAPPLLGAALLLHAVSVATPDGSLLAPSGLTLEALPGKVTVLVGPNGEGKSTAILVLAGLVAPTSGSVTARLPDTTAVLLASPPGFQGEGVEPDGWAAQCAWVPQRPVLGLEARTLSLGERQRVALSRAFTSRRPLVLLDEPTAHLHHGARVNVIADIRRLADAGATVIVASHDPAVIAEADAVVAVAAAAVAGVTP